jgi:hypothetical protein
MKLILSACIAMLMLCGNATAQFTENFSDSNFTANPPWTGNSTDWIINSSKQLQSNNTVANSSFYISTANILATTAQWDFYCNITFNPSSANYVDVYLTASSADLTLPSTTGYFVRIGNTNDEICLYRKDATGLVTKIIDGVDGVLNSSNNIMKIRVVRNATDLWSLSRDLSGTGTNYFTEGTITDNTYSSAAFFGILVKQSTASFFQRHFFDDISIQPYVPDITPPAISSVTAVSATAVDVLFSEPVDLNTSQMLSDYSVDNNAGLPATAVRDAANTSLVHLTFSNPLPPRINLNITVSGVNDIAGNTLINGIKTFVYFIPLPYDVVIDEIMADPDPPVSLPNNEWLELKNTTFFPINLQNWKLGKPGSESGPMPSYILPAGGYVIVCTGSVVTTMSAYGPVVSVTSFPSLSNDADHIYLRAPQGLIVHSVNYTDDWYKNELKKAGGWSLEMTDTHNPCTGADNWQASVDPRGGTPGSVNSVDAVNADITPPRLLRAFAPDSLHVTLVFNEPLDSTSASDASAYSVSDGIGTPVSALPLSVSFDHVLLALNAPLTRDKIYTVTATAVTDCSGNAVGASHTARVGLYEHTDSIDIVVNEIMFNPKAGGVDYAEFFNRSKKTLDLKNAYIANRNSTGAIASVTQFSTEDYLFFPGDYIVVTSDPMLVQRDYVANNPDAFLKLSSTPSFNDDAGNVIILNEQGALIDEVAYSEKWHFALITNDEGVALERIDPDGASIQSNFHSAATNVGYGTPTYKNSQYRADPDLPGTITITPAVVSPDNDGMDDFATISYDFPEPGYTADITIFDAAGRPVRLLQQNALCGIKGYYRWDGLGEKQQKLPTGVYIVYTKIFNLEGKTKQFKNTIVVARK